MKKTVTSQALDRYVVDTRPLCHGMPFLLTDAAHPRMVLKHGSHFLVLDEGASIPTCNTLGYGYYYYDTRHISQWEVFLNDLPLSLLSSNVALGYTGRFLYTNVQTEQIPQQKLIIEREIVLADLLWERISLENFLPQPLDCELKIKFQSDFADIFEVRGLNRLERGQRMIPRSGEDLSLFLAYKGVDNLLLETIIEFFGIKPTAINEGEVSFKLQLDTRQRKELELCVSTAWGGHESAPDQRRIGYTAAKNSADEKYKEWETQCATISTEHELFNLPLERNYRDLYILRQPTPRGFGFAAGIPWYCSVFGRDSVITGLQVLPFLPELAKESIQVLAAYQGQKESEYTAESPGRIMHELRLGELARTQQIPHTPYYGTADATQLWLLLLCEYLHWTGDFAFAQQLWPNVKHAVDWLDRVTADGYLTYQRLHDKELENQGWKDSHDSVMHTNGQLASPPIAMCEVQAYLYAARIELAKVAELLGHHKFAAKLRIDAENLKRIFQRDFWLESEKFIALALDGNKQQVQTLASNAGHCLFTGILDDDKAQAVADRLMSWDFCSGWGIRTLSGLATAFNPISYHNGSIWPHDNAMIAHGLRKIGRIKDVHTILQALYDVSKCKPDYRVPELFCGFERRDSFIPIDYPVSCSPQSWAAGSIFQMLKACINFQPDATHGCISIVNPSLPEWLGKVTIRNLRIGQGELDLAFEIRDGSTFCHILKKTGNIRVIVES